MFWLPCQLGSNLRGKNWLSKKQITVKCRSLFREDFVYREIKQGVKNASFVKTKVKLLHVSSVPISMKLPKSVCKCIKNEGIIITK